MRENILSVVGQPETKQMQDMLPDILKQVGPQQYGFLKDVLDKTGKAAAGDAGDDEDDVPPLVQGNFEQAAKWTELLKAGRQWRALRTADYQVPPPRPPLAWAEQKKKQMCGVRLMIETKA